MDKEKFYNNSPTWLQNILISMQGFHFEKNRVDKTMCWKVYEELLKSQYWSKDQIREYQNKQLLLLLNEAFEYVPYYQRLSKELGCTIHDFNGLEDIYKLPYLSKDKVRGNEHEFINQRFDLKGLLKGHTSGTTGSPMKLFYTRDTFSKRWAFELRLRNWATLQGIYHPRRVQFTGRDIVPVNQKGKAYWRYNIASNTLHCSSSHVSEASAAGYADAILRYQPELIDGYPSTISSLSKICLLKGYRLPSVKAIRVSAETLFDADRELIETAFNGKVFNQYGSSESSCFCSDNSLGEMLIHPEYGYVEILPDGEVVTTSFINHVMPLIRYRIGDVVQPSDGISGTKEGRNFKRLTSVMGRVDDVLMVNGRYISRLGSVFKALIGVIESQVVLRGSTSLIVNLMVDSRYNTDSEQVLLGNLRKKIGNEVDIQIKYVEKIPRGANGKFKAIVDLTT